MLGGTHRSLVSVMEVTMELDFHVMLNSVVS